MCWYPDERYELVSTGELEEQCDCCEKRATFVCVRSDDPMAKYRCRGCVYTYIEHTSETAVAASDV